MGLGNQMFIYATGYGVSRKCNMELNLDISKIAAGGSDGRYLELLNYNLKYNKLIKYLYKYNKFWNKLGLNNLQRYISYGFNTPIYYQKNTWEEDDNVYKFDTSFCMDGDWDNWHYFIEYRNDLREILTPKSERSQSVNEILKNIQLDKDKSVSLHIRRGDYESIEGWTLPLEYYEEALKKMGGILGKDIRVYVFSDDINYCQMNLKKFEDKYQITYIDYESDNRTVDDMYLMSNCSNNIIANSTYSWWAAFLNKNDNATVICPTLLKWKDEFFLDSWIKLPVKDLV